MQQHVDWLGKLADNVPLFEIPAIPGTHNSATFRPLDPFGAALPWVWAQCQSASIREQLDMGVRSLDLRLLNETKPATRGRDTGKPQCLIRISHSFRSDQTFAGIVRTAMQFLREHPSEFLIVRFKRDWPHRKKWSALAQQRLLTVLNSVPIHQALAAPADARTRLGAVRGRIIFACPDDGLHIRPNNVAFCMRLDVWNAKSQKRARELLHAYCAQRWREDLRTTCHTKGLMRSVGANVVVGALPPRAVARDMNKWLCDLLQRPPCQARVKYGQASRDQGGGACHNSECECVHFGVLVVDFVDERIVDAMVRYTLQVFAHRRYSRPLTMESERRSTNGESGMERKDLGTPEKDLGATANVKTQDPKRNFKGL